MRLPNALRRIGPAVLAVVLVAGTALVAAPASAADPSLTLSPTSGPIGTTTEVTLSEPCGSGLGQSTLYVNLNRVGGGPGGTFQSLPIGTGGRLTRTWITIPTTAQAGTYSIGVTCYRPFLNPLQFGVAFFRVTGGAPLPVLTVSPGAAPVGSVIDVSGPCQAAARGYASLAVAMFNRSDPRNDHIAYAYASGPGPVLHASLRIPAYFARGEATITATCFDYVTEQPFTESSFTVLGDIAVSIGDSSVVEGRTGARSMRFALTMSEPINEAISVPYITAGGDATSGVDYTATAGTATIPAGATATSISIPVLGDTGVEVKETFGVWLGDLSNTEETHLGRALGVGRIIDDDPATGVKVSIGDASLVEGKLGTRALRIPLTLSEPAPGPVSVRYSTAGDTAKSGIDYNAVSGTVTIATGRTSAIVTVPIRVDTLVEPTESFTVSIREPSGATIGRTTGVGKILDDDRP